MKRARTGIPPAALVLFRRTNRMRQAELAELLNVSRQTISNWECGEYPVPSWVPYYLKLIIETTGLTIDVAALKGNPE